MNALAIALFSPYRQYVRRTRARTSRLWGAVIILASAVLFISFFLTANDNYKMWVYKLQYISVLIVYMLYKNNFLENDIIYFYNLKLTKIEVMFTWNYRSKITTHAQFTVLMEFMEQHEDLANGRLNCSSARVTGDALWQELSEQLNSIGPPVRSNEGWKKVCIIIIL